MASHFAPRGHGFGPAAFTFSTNPRKMAPYPNQNGEMKPTTPTTPSNNSPATERSSKHETHVLIEQGNTEGKDKNKKTHTVYKVEVHNEHTSWFVFRRYSDFHKLYEYLKKNVPSFHGKLPGKRFYNNFDPHFLKTRRDALDEFLRKIMEDNNLRQLPAVREFLLVDKHETREEDDDSKDEETPDESEESSSEKDVNLGPSERRHGKPSDFQFLKVVGKGSFGKVFLAKHSKEGSIFAVKVLQKKMIIKRNESAHIMSERNVLLKNLNHPFLVGLHYSFQTRDRLYFVLDYVNGGEMFFHLQKERTFPESRARFYSAQMGSALGYLHSQGIVYRDLKPENILLDREGNIVLTDFGLCKEGLQESDTTSTFCGTPEYLAPEILRKEAYDKAVDWWCLGAVTYEMLYGLPPWYSRNVSEMYEGILNRPLKLKASISFAARDLLSKLLTKERKDRLGSGGRDFDEIKAHEFFQPLSWPALLKKEIKPPYVPDLVDIMDTRNIDNEFTREPIPASIGASQKSQGCLSTSVCDPDGVFLGFSYAPSYECH